MEGSALTAYCTSLELIASYLIFSSLSLSAIWIFLFFVDFSVFNFPPAYLWIWIFGGHVVSQYHH